MSQKKAVQLSMEGIEVELEDCNSKLEDLQAMTPEREEKRLARTTCHSCCCYRIKTKKCHEYPAHTPFCNCATKGPSESHPHSFQECPTQFRKAHQNAPKLFTEEVIKQEISVLEKKINDLQKAKKKQLKNQHKFATDGNWSEAIGKLKNSTRVSGNAINLNNVLTIVHQELHSRTPLSQGDLSEDDIAVLASRVLGVNPRSGLGPQSITKLVISKEKESEEKADLEKEVDIGEIDREILETERHLTSLHKRKREVKLNHVRDEVTSTQQYKKIKNEASLRRRFSV